jgi:hypothetical protein
MPPLELRGWASFSASATANEELADLGDDLVAAPVRQHPSDNDRTAVHPPRRSSCGPGSVRTTLFRTMPRSFEWAHRQVPFVGFADTCLRGVGQVRSAWAACHGVCVLCVCVVCMCACAMLLLPLRLLLLLLLHESKTLSLWLRVDVRSRAFCRSLRSNFPLPLSPLPPPPLPPNPNPHPPS